MGSRRVALLSLLGLLHLSCGSRGLVSVHAEARPEVLVSPPTEDVVAVVAEEHEVEPPPPDAVTLAEGRTLVAVGPAGFLSTWRRIDPAPANAADEEEAEPEVVSQGSWRMELGDLVRGAGSEVELGVELLSPQATHAYLMVGFRGGASVYLDGEELGAAESADRFRDDFLFVRLELAAGEHGLRLRFVKPDRGAWRGAVRFLSERHRAGPGNVALSLGQISEETATARLARAVHFDEAHELHDGTPSLRVRVHLPGGGIREPIEVHVGEEARVLAPTAGVHGAELVHREPIPERGSVSLEGRVLDRTERLGARIASDRIALSAAASLAAVVDSAPEASRAPIAWRQRELERIVREHDPDQQWRQDLSREARAIVRTLERERDPFGTVRGYERMAFFSRIDGTPQEYELFAPPSYRPDGTRRWPLLITLHGYKGNAGDYFRNTFGLARHPEEGETLVGHGRHGAAPETGPMFVIGPTGRGQSFYRHAGEVDIYEAMEDVSRRFRIDPSRIYITGGSMGGTGAAYLPYRRPDVFAASAALAGYHDQRVREDTEHEGLSEAERFLTAHRSDVDWAENGLHLPTLLVRGTRDRPLEWTRVLAHRLDALGYDYEHREPELGHNVWTETYAGGAIFRWMARHRRPEHPRHVILRTARERTRESYWVRVEQRQRVDAFAHVDATIDNDRVVAEIEGARAVTFSPGPPLRTEGAPLTVRIRETEIQGDAPLTVELVGSTWQRSTRSWPEEGARRPGVSGPIRDVYHEPLTFVVGTQDEDHTLINRLVARHWSRPKGWIVDYPVVDDVDVTDAMIEERVLVLIGPPSSNSVLARLADRLPIQLSPDGIRLRGELHEGEQIGTVFVAPNPLNPDRSLLVIAGASPLGTWRSTQLPDILPDYVIFDEAVAPARDRWACGGTGCQYRAHGFFDMRWQ